MSTLVNGIIQTPKGYAVKNFGKRNARPIEIGKLSFKSYEAAVQYLANLLYPQSYKPYLLAVQRLTPDMDIWNNLVFIGHADGFYDHEQKQFRNARQMNMDAGTPKQLAYLEALETTYHSILTMVHSDGEAI